MLENLHILCLSDLYTFFLNTFALYTKVDNVKSHPGKKVSELRKKLKVSQIVLAKSIGINQSHLSDIERGVKGLSYNIAFRIGQKLGVTTNYFLESSNKTWKEGNYDGITSSQKLDEFLEENPELYLAVRSVQDFSTFLTEMTALKDTILDVPLFLIASEINAKKDIDSKTIEEKYASNFSLLMEFEKITNQHMKLHRSLNNLIRVLNKKIEG